MGRLRAEQTNQRAEKQVGGDPDENTPRLMIRKSGVCVCVCILTVYLYGALDLPPLPPAVDATQQCSFMFNHHRVKGQHRVRLIGCHGGGEGAVPQERPGHTERPETVLNLTHQLLPFPQFQQRPFGGHVHAQAMKAA